MQIKTLVGALASLFVVAAEGKTVAWYHFDGGAAGERAKPDVDFVNAADATSLPAHSRWMSASTISKMDSENLSSYACTFPEGVVWTDGVSGAAGSERMGLHMTSTGTYGPASVVIIDDDEKLRLPQLTAEIFVKFDTAYASLNTAQVPVLGGYYGTGGADKSWALHVNGDGQFAVQAYISGKKAFVMSTKVTTNARDGKWHHLAMTYNGTHIRIYYDYQEIAFQEVHGSITYSDENIFAAGANARSNMGRWSGWIDEVRISDEALTPDKFVHVARPLTDAQKAEAAKVTGSDTLVYQSFDTAPLSGADGDIFAGLVAGNEATGAQALPMAFQTPADGQVPVVVTGAKDKVKGAAVSADPHANAGAWKFESGATTLGHSAMLTADDHTGYADGAAHRVFAEDSTIEMFVKLDQLPTQQMFFFHAKHQSNENGTQIYCTETKNNLASLMVGLLSQEAHDKAKTGESWALNLVNCGTAISDCKWHHIAVVNARSDKRVLVYFDYKPCDPVENFLLATNVSSNAGRRDLRISGRGDFDDSGSRQLDGCVDEVRITGRALSPREFLSISEVPSIAGEPVVGGRPCAYLGFDDASYALTPFATSYPTYGTTSGEFALSDKVPGDGLIANRVGMGLAKENLGSVNLKPGSFFYENVVPLIGLQTQTVEFYAKVDEYGSAPNFLALETTRTNNSFTAWGVKYHRDIKRLYVNMDNLVGKMQSIQFDTPKFASARWHHVAVTFEKKTVDAAEVTEIRLYLDGEEQPVVANNRHAGTNYLDGGIMRWLEDSPKLTIGRMFGGTAHITGWLDEIRISEGVLTPDQFLLSGKTGCMLLIR